MSWTEKIFAYCERGSDPGFWAEPLNAVTNAAFLIAAAIAVISWRSARAPLTPAHTRPGLVEFALIALVGVIGVGSFLFHTLATRWAAIADTAPIGVFMLAYLGYAAVRFLKAGWAGAVGGLVVFIATAIVLPRLPMAASLGATMGYVPALLAMLVIGVWATLRRHPAGPWILSAAAVFVLSLTFRVLDRQFCPATIVAGRAWGTHFLWHLLNGLVLGLLLQAAVRHPRHGGTPKT